MMRMNICQAVFQLTVLFLLSSKAEFVKDLVGCDVSVTTNKWCIKRRNTVVFNMFVFCQFWNEINCRKLKEVNIFSRFFDSLWFTGVLIFTFAVQILMVEFVPSDFAGTNGLNAKQWLICVGVGFLALPIGFLSRFIPIKYLEDRFDQGADFGDDVEESDEESEGEDELEEEREENLARDDLHAAVTLP